MEFRSWLFRSRCRAAQLAFIKQISRQVSRGSAVDYQADEQGRIETYELESNMKAGFGLWANLTANSGTEAIP